MRITRKSAAVAVLAVSALALSACSTDADGGGAGLTAGSSVNIGWNQPFYSYNADSQTGNATANAIIKYMTMSNFNYYDAELALIPDESFGTYEKVSEDPLQIRYTYADTAQWSDGVAAGPADYLLQWAALSGKFNDIEPETDDEGNVTNQDALDAGIYFDASSPCVALIEDTPAIDGSSITFTYSKPFADWETCFGQNLPAHVVGQRALGIDDAGEATDALVAAITDASVGDLSKIAKVWSNDFNYTALPDDPGLYVSSGAYVITEFVKDQYLVLKANENYNGDLTAKIETVTIRYNEDPLAQVQALQNGELDLISPQATSDVLDLLDQIDTLESESSEEGTYEHVDLQFANGGPFDPATYGGDAAKALKVRQAFLKVIPRQQIVDNLIKPLNPTAELRQSFTVIPGSPNYESVVATNGQADQYGETDVAGAEKLLAEAGVTTPVTVRLLFAPTNERRINENDLIAASAKDAGFDVVPYQGSEAGWGSDLSNLPEAYDAALFGWQSESTAVTESDANYRTGGPNNFYGYSNEEVDSLFDQLQTETEPAVQGEILGDVEKHLVDDAFGVTLFQFPGVMAWNPKNIGNLQKISISPSIFYGFWEWNAGDQQPTEG